MENYKNIWYDMIGVIPFIPVCSILWDIYNLSTVYEDFRLENILEIIKKEINIPDDDGKNVKNVLIEEPLNTPNLFKGRDIYFNFQNYSPTLSKSAAGFTVGEISLKYLPPYFGIKDNTIHITPPQNDPYQQADSFNEFNVLSTDNKIISLITIRSNQPEEFVVFYELRDTEYHAGFNLRKEALVYFMSIFFHELGAHIVSSTGKQNSGQGEHDRVGWDEPNIRDIEGGLNELIHQQIKKGLIQKETTTAEGKIYEIDVAPVYRQPIPNEWNEAIKRVAEVLVDPYFDTKKYIAYLPELYKNKL